MTIKETKLRIEPTLDEWLAAQAAIAGIAKTKYIMQVLEAHKVANLHTDPKLSPNVSPVSLIDVSLYAEVAELKARVSKLEQSNPDTIPNAIPRFEVGQPITGQHSTKYALLWDSFEEKQMVGRVEYYLSNKLGVICKVTGVARESNKKKLKVIATFPGDPVVLNPDGTFLNIYDGGNIKWIKQSELAASKQPEPAIAEPTAVVEPTNDEIAVEANQVAISSSIEPVEPAPIKLSTEELLETFKPKLANPGMVNTIRTNLGQVKHKNLVNGWTAKHDPEGRVWIPTDETRQYWVVQPAVAS